MRQRLKLRAPISVVLFGALESRIRYVATDIEDFELVVPEHDEITFSVRPVAKSEASKIVTRVAELVDVFLANYREVPTRTLWSQSSPSSRFHEDPHPINEVLGEWLPLAPGRYAFGAQTTRLIAALDAVFLQLAERVGAQPRQYPSLLPVDSLRRCGYLAHSPHYLSWVTHLRPEWAVVRDFVTHTAPPTAVLAEHFGAVECALAPAQCLHHLASLQDRRLTRPLPITITGRCFRHESFEMRGLERLWEFSMREIVFVGDDEAVSAHRDAVEKAVLAQLAEWEIGYEVCTATDAFFLGAAATQAQFQAAFELKREIRATLPYRGIPLAIASSNLHQNFFGKVFDIRLASGELASSTCFGIGLERLVLVIHSQFGVRPENWPQRLGALLA